jgi:glycerol-3-phosphate dehydrogenase
VHYLPVLQLAFKFAIGNAALKNSSFEVFKYCRRAEADTLARSVKRSFSCQTKAGELSVGQLAVNKGKHNLLLTLLNQKIALRVWKEYRLIRDKFAAREGGIVSEAELTRLIEKQRLEELRFYSKAGNQISARDILLRRAASQMLDSFHRIFRALHSSSLQ